MDSVQSVVVPLTDGEAVSLIRSRVKEMMADAGIQAAIHEMKAHGHSEADCQTWLIQKAVATLAGYKNDSCY